MHGVTASLISTNPQIALARYSEVAPTLNNLSNAIEQLPRRLPPTPTTSSTAPSRRSLGSLSSRHSHSPRDQPPSFPEGRERPPSFVEDPSTSRSVSTRSFEGSRMPGEFPGDVEDDLVFEMSGITADD